MPDYTLKQRKLENSQRPCSFRGCANRRWKISPLCSKHTQAKLVHGVPDGRAILTSEIEPFRKLVRRFLKKHAEHPAVLAALSAVTELITPTSEAEPKGRFDARGHLNRYLRHMRDENVSALDILEETTATYLLSRFDPRRLPSNEALTWALARAAFYSVELPPLRKAWRFKGLKGECVGMVRRKPGSSSCKLLGTKLRRTLGLFYERVAEALDKQREQEIVKQMERRRALATPFTEEQEKN
jgi:hypothetical protein